MDANPAGTTRQATSFYFTAWRWHFWAGLYVIPFLVMLALTGLCMFWVSAITEINGERGYVTPGETPVPLSQLTAAAESAVPGGQAGQYIAPMGPDRVAVFRINAGEASQTVVINPYTAEVIETFPWDAGLYNLANNIHGTLLIGDTGDRLIEVAASLAVLLVLSGLYLHWPRKSRGTSLRSMLVPDVTARRRALWKSLHGVLGTWMSVVMLVFLVSGLSWTGIWGGKMVQAWNTFPAEKWGAPLSDATHAEMNHGPADEVPWTLEQTPMPQSGSLAGQSAVAMPVTVDGVAAFAGTLGFPGRFQISFPADETGVWTISHDSMSNDGHNPAADRTLHIDRYSGNVLADVPYADYSPYAKMMAWGIAFHEGDLGLWNLALNTLFCLSMIFIPVSGLVMWWKRRPKAARRVAAPPKVEGRLWVPGVVVLGLTALAFPLAAVALVAVGALDFLVLRNIPRVKRALS
ncbi:PepSY domain-containing protein [Maritimibacter sp. DP1N21-5]|nr:PepSY domain-containing protein [Maritimibacter sp. DP1N21-5]